MAEQTIDLFLENRMLDGILDPVYLVNSGKKIVDANKAARDLFGDTQGLSLEKVARIRALLRRSNVESNIPILEYADIALNTETYRVTRDGKNIEVSPTGFKVLQTLLERPEQVFSRERLLSRVWGGDIFVEPRTIDVHIKRLRSAMNAGGKADLVRTVRGVGYALDQKK